MAIKLIDIDANMTYWIECEGFIYGITQTQQILDGDGLPFSDRLVDLIDCDFDLDDECYLIRLDDGRKIVSYSNLTELVND